MPKSILLLDVDGVLSVKTCKTGHRIQSGGHKGHIQPSVVQHVQALHEHFDIWWATSWEQHANRVISPLLDIGERPVVKLTYKTRRSWKLGAIQATIDRHANGRPVAWVDDHIGASARRWAERRASTTLIHIDSKAGLGYGHVQQLVEFAQTHNLVGGNDHNSECLAGGWPKVVWGPQEYETRSNEVKKLPTEGLGVRRVMFLGLLKTHHLWQNRKEIS